MKSARDRVDVGEVMESVGGDPNLKKTNTVYLDTALSLDRSDKTPGLSVQKEVVVSEPGSSREG